MAGSPVNHCLTKETHRPVTPVPTLRNLGLLLSARRGDRGIRAVAKEIGISHATLSRIERGFLPDLETFRKVCEWLGVDPGTVLKVKSRSEASVPTVAVHFKIDSALAPDTAHALARLILATQRAMRVAPPPSPGEPPGE